MFGKNFLDIHITILYNILDARLRAGLVGLPERLKIMNFRRLKKSVLSIIALAVAVTSALALASCAKDGDDTPVQGTYNVVIPAEIARPTGLPDYSLTIEWLGTYFRNRPTAVVFHGVTDYDEKTDVTLDPGVYTSDITSTYSEAVLGELGDWGNDLAYIWNRAGFNIAVFHYENFADDTYQNVAGKVFSGAKMSYQDVNGTTRGDGGLSFNLTEAFVSEWLKVKQSDLDGGGYAMMEVRFIGVGTGATLALSAADYLNALYEQGKIGAMYLATRVDLLDPYLSQTGISTVVDYREQTTLGSQLKYASELIVKLASAGVVFDLVEGREKYYEYDNNNYSGIEVTTSNGKIEVNFLDTGDSAYYLDIKENVAYLNFRETFSTKTAYAQAFDSATLAAENAVLDWYLYSVNGSDDTSVGKQGGSHPVLDGYNRTGVTSGSSVVKYGISSWTPTVYLRTVRGVEYTQSRYSSSTETDYVLRDFQAENFQISGSKLDGANIIAGYIYCTPDENNPYVELRRDRVVAGIEINFVLTKTGERNITLSAVSGKDGFYMIDLGTEYEGYSLRISVNVPANRYQTLTATTSGSANYAKVSANALNSTSGTTASMYSSSSGRYLIGIYNGGLLKIS